MITEERGKRPKYLTMFWRYHDRNPHVFTHLLAGAKEQQRAGRSRVGVKSLAERLRDSSIVADDGHGVKFTNTLTAYYARILIFVRPSLGTLITLKRLGVRFKRKEGPARAYDPAPDEPTSRELREFWMTRQWPKKGDGK